MINLRNTVTGICSKGKINKYRNLKEYRTVISCPILFYSEANSDSLSWN